MTSSNPNAARCIHNDKLDAFAAALLISLGLILQWTELFFARFMSRNGWLFATLFGEIWNIINISPSAAQWHQNLRYWPLLLVITGAAILFSRNRRKFHSD
jgi:hypothetical protein